LVKVTKRSSVFAVPMVAIELLRNFVRHTYALY
jgi:hypothetical protein